MIDLGLLFLATVLPGFENLSFWNVVNLLTGWNN